MENKTRPIIVKFLHFKTKDSVLSQRAKLKGTSISIGEDFCRETRQSRKKLTEFGKASGQAYSLRANKLIINKKSYIYSAATDSVCEIEFPRRTNATDNTVPAVDPHRASS